MKKQLQTSTLFLFLSFWGMTGFAVREEEAAEKRTAEEAANDLLNGEFAKPSDPLDAINRLEDSWTDPLEEASLNIDVIEASVDSEDTRKLDRLMDTVETQNALDEAEEKKNMLHAIKKQNTLLASYGRVGIYKSDVVEVGLQLADFAADLKLYQFLKQRRIDYIVGKLLGGNDELVATIKRVNDSHARYEERSVMDPSMAKILKNKTKALDTLLNPLRRYVSENHSLAPGYIPFNRKTILPLLARWGWEKLSAEIKNRMIVSPSVAGTLGVDEESLLFTDPKFLREKNDALFYAFDENSEGKLVRRTLTDTPISLSTCIKGLRYASNPVQGIQKILFSSTDNPWLGRWKFISKKLGLNLPDFLFTNAMRNGLEFLGMGYSLNYLEHQLSREWEEYVVKNRELLYRLVTTYTRLLTKPLSTESELTAAREAIRAFVVKGHESTSWIPGKDLSTWWNARDNGRNMISRWLGIGAAALIVGKVAHWWYGSTGN